MGPGGLAALQMFRMGLINVFTLIDALEVSQREDEFTAFVKSARAEFGRDLWDPED